MAGEVWVACLQLTVLERWHTGTAGERWALLKLSGERRLEGKGMGNGSWVVYSMQTVSLRLLAIRPLCSCASNLPSLAVAYLTNAFVVPLLAAYFAGSSSSW